ncbi:hypothetical protein TWF718_011169 [Orbilia javanica]|uniref:Secreted protein n=1 Tax=Orbilia javanica TaxID=47235 RepID=A0AAN8MM56_9PEZI
MDTCEIAVSVLLAFRTLAAPPEKRAPTCTTVILHGGNALTRQHIIVQTRPVVTVTSTVKCGGCVLQVVTVRQTISLDPPLPTTRTVQGAQPRLMQFYCSGTATPANIPKPFNEPEDIAGREAGGF